MKYTTRSKQGGAIALKTGWQDDYCIEQRRFGVEEVSCFWDETFGEKLLSQKSVVLFCLFFFPPIFPQSCNVVLLSLEVNFLGKLFFWGRGGAFNSGPCIVRFTLASIFKFLSTVTSHPVLQGKWVARVFIMWSEFVYSVMTIVNYLREIRPR